MRCVLWTRLAWPIGVAALALLTTGCTGYQPPKTWEKGALAHPDMRMNARTLDDRLHQHLYERKEGASGGYGVGGGGCGCN